MGVKIDVRYAGELHCELTHGPSGSKTETDAPKDNAGKGEAFSPTDLLAASLASCAVTTMAIKAPGEGIDFGDADATVEKIMTTSGPRRIARLEAVLHLSSQLSPAHRERLQSIARSCPVALSLSPDVEVEMRFIYDR